MLSGFCHARLGVVFCSVVIGSRYTPCTTDRVASGASFPTGEGETVLIVDLCLNCVCSIGSGITRCSLFMVLYLGRMCQCGLHAVLWSHIGILIRFLAIEPRSSAGSLFLSQCPCGTILPTLYSMVLHWRV